MNVEWSVKQAAAAWQCSCTLVRKLMSQGRVPFKRRHGRVLIIESVRPLTATRGELTKKQRAAWPKGRVA